MAGVVEAAGQALVPGKGPDLEVVTPRGVRRGYPDRLCWNKAEATVVGRVANQPHQWLAERVGRTKNSVHQGSTDTSSPAARENTQRPETQSWLGIDMGTRSYNVADHQVVLDRDQRQLRNPTSIVSQPRDQRRFARIPTWLRWRCAVLDAAERGSRDRTDRLNVVGELTSNHHHGTVGPFADGRQRIFAR